LTVVGFPCGLLTGVSSGSMLIVIMGL